jgi:uncharacterized protein (DUF697 family)
MDGFNATLKRVLDGETDVASDEEKEQTVRRLIHTGCAAAVVATLQPLPVVDTALIMPIQVGMFQGIGRVHGHRLDKKSVWEILNNVKTGLVTQHATLIAAKFVPAAGTLLAACVAHGLTYSVGVLADSYFRTGRTMVPEAMQSTLKRAYGVGVGRMCKSSWNHTRLFFCRRPGAADRLNAIQRERRAGRMSDEEAERALDDVLNDR